MNQQVLDWQNRPLESVYCIVWMDGIVFKVRQAGKVVNKTIYLAVGLNREGYKEILGMWLGQNESAAFWQGVMTDLKARGVEDILVTVTDNLNGFTGAITNVFPMANTQICVVHQIRNFAHYVVWKDKKEFAEDMKLIYNAPNRDVAKVELERFTQKWGHKYPYAVQSWRNNWDELTVFFDFPLEIRKIICTTNLIENLKAHRLPESPHSVFNFTLQFSDKHHIVGSFFQSRKCLIEYLFVILRTILFSKAIFNIFNQLFRLKVVHPISVTKLCNKGWGRHIPVIIIYHLNP